MTQEFFQFQFLFQVQKLKVIKQPAAVLIITIDFYALAAQGQGVNDNVGIKGKFYFGKIKFAHLNTAAERQMTAKATGKQTPEV